MAGFAADATAPEINPPANGQDWTKLSSTEKLFWSIGYSQGYLDALNKIDILPADARTTWERPVPPSVRKTPLIELYGGYAFARFAGSAGTSSNLNGAMGSFGWNVKPWLQIVADSSYSVVTANGTKNVLYGNHFGPRYFYRKRNRWGLTPFAEALVGGSRSDTTVSGTGGYTTSDNTLSYKVGGGIDIHPSRHIDIRLFDVDYYRTSFGTNLHQNNYWVSTGIVLRLFGGTSE